MKRTSQALAVLAAALVTWSTPGDAQMQQDPDRLSRVDMDFQALIFRNIGPFRGGRVTAVAGHADDSQLYYMGATGGGVWKTTNGGDDWFNVSDNHFRTGAVGAIDVAPSNPDVVVVGMGESPFRGVASSQGDGVYKSEDGGVTWSHLGLEDTLQISSIRIHPSDPNTIWVAAQGDIWTPSEARGVFKTTDGGATWRKVLAGANGTSGAVDLKIVPSNPDVIYAAFWDHQRLPWFMRSGGPGSGIWKSVDGGETWSQLTVGLPSEELGKIGVAPSPADPNRVWAIVEAKENGGLYRSEDGGNTWSLVNRSRLLQARSWYYMHIFADPKDKDLVYIQNSPFLKSPDGGTTLQVIRGPHVDHHDLWINPDNPQVMIDANDGGATVSYDGGQTWSTQQNQPTAQFYRVAVDNQMPYYRVYGGQQDNSTVSILSNGYDGGIGREDYEAVGGCESAHVAFNRDNPRYVYATCYLGLISEFDTKDKIQRSIQAYPELAFGVSPRERKYRFNWNAPVLVSQHNPNVIFHAGNHVLKSTDRGTSWSEISPDLTRNEPEKQGPGGGPITNEVSENYNTILYLAESQHERGVLWAGTDDGKVQLTRNGGSYWNDVTPDDMQDGMVNAIEVSPHDKRTAYLAYTRYKQGDRKPYIYRTRTYGRTWDKLAGDLPDGAFVRVVREDPEREGLLFAGTELGLFVSFDTGRTWRRLEQNLPRVPITDIKIKGDDLVLSTQGRAFWVLDDLSVLRQFSVRIASKRAHLYTPAQAVRPERAGSASGRQAPNTPPTAAIYFSLGKELNLRGTRVTFDLKDEDGKILRRWASRPQDPDQVPIRINHGLNRLYWSFRIAPIEPIRGQWVIGGVGGSVFGHQVAPGRYTVEMKLNGRPVDTKPLDVVWDPRLDTSAAAIAEQQAMANRIYTILSELHRSVNALREVKAQAQDALENPALKERAEAVIAAIDAWERSIINPDREFFQDVLNWPDKLHTHLQLLYFDVNGATTGVTEGMRTRLTDLEAQWADAVARREAVINGEIKAFNEAGPDGSLPDLFLPPMIRPSAQ